MKQQQPKSGPVTPLYLEHFRPSEFRFRWVEATGLDPALPFRANHLAARLGTLWVDVNHVSTTYDELHRISRMAFRTLHRAVTDLSTHGWISIVREFSQMHITLQLDDAAVELLLAERERGAYYAGRSNLTKEWTRFIYDTVRSAYGLPASDSRPGGIWRAFYAKLRSMVAHMVCHEAEARKLIDELTDMPPYQILDLPSFLLSRAAAHVRSHPHLARKAPIPQYISGNTNVSQAINDLADKLSTQRVLPREGHEGETQ